VTLPRAAALALLLTACAGSPASPPPAARPIPFPVAAERVGVLASAAAAKAGAVLYDGGAAIELPDGRALWTFGDTFFGERGEPGNPDLERFFGPGGAGRGLRSIRGAVTHTALAGRRADWTGAGPDAAWFGAPGAVERGPLVPAPVEEGEPASLRVWPMHGIHAGGQVLLFYGVVRITKDPPPFNFQVLGVGLAEGDADRPPFRPGIGPSGWRVFPKDGPAYGAWVLQADMGITEGFDYVYGTKPDSLGNRVHVARVPHGREASPEQWRFFDGKDWSEDPARAAPIFDDAPGELSVSWNSHLKRFVAVHARVLSREVVARGSDRPEGPWSASTVLFTVPPPAAGDPGFVYAAKEQPLLAGEDGRVLHVSVVDSREGVPAVWRVTLP
jgi:hypothetical protein